LNYLYLNLIKILYLILEKEEKTLKEDSNKIQKEKEINKFNQNHNKLQNDMINKTEKIQIENLNIQKEAMNILTNITCETSFTKTTDEESPFLNAHFFGNM